MAVLRLSPLSTRTKIDELRADIARRTGLDPRHLKSLALDGAAARLTLDESRVSAVLAGLAGARWRGRPLAAEVVSRDGPDPEHLAKLRRWLALESEAEEAELRERLAGSEESEARAAGTALLDLVAGPEEGAAGGVTLLELRPRSEGRRLPWSRFRPGAPALLSSASGDGGPVSAVVTSLRDRSIRIALRELPTELADARSLRLDLGNDAISAERCRLALDQARFAVDRLLELREVLLGERPPAAPEPAPEPDWLNSGLNAPQRAAITFALNSPDFAIIDGPPGTGKTTTVVELIRQAIRRGERVLATAPSHMAVDNIVEKLLAAGEDPLRLGHPARVQDSLRRTTLDARLLEHEEMALARKREKDGRKLMQEAARCSRDAEGRERRRELRREARQLFREARETERRTLELLLDRHAIVCSTLTGLAPRLLGDRRFDRVVIDEACQATEPAAWIPLPRAGRVVFAGDPQQLPPTILSRAAAREGYAISLPERLIQRFGRGVARRLTIQYRMHEAIMTFSSLQLYDGELEADPSVAGHTLAELPGVADSALTRSPRRFVDTAGSGFEEHQASGESSRSNPGEVRLVAKLITELRQAGVPASAIGLITPYSAQVCALRDALREGDEDDDELEIDSVDGFQGREKEVIVISLVRSNERGEIGFLGDTRRMNVALTRARRHCCVVGDSATIAGHPFYGALIEDFASDDALTSIWEVAPELC